MCQLSSVTALIRGWVCAVSGPCFEWSMWWRARQHLRWQVRSVGTCASRRKLEPTDQKPSYHLFLLLPILSLRLLVSLSPASLLPHWRSHVTQVSTTSSPCTLISLHLAVTPDWEWCRTLANSKTGVPLPFSSLLPFLIWSYRCQTPTGLKKKKKTSTALQIRKAATLVFQVGSACCYKWNTPGADDSGRCQLGAE